MSSLKSKEGIFKGEGVGESEFMTMQFLNVLFCTINVMQTIETNHRKRKYKNKTKDEKKYNLHNFFFRKKTTTRGISQSKCI